MDNLRAVIRNLYCYVSPREILKGKIRYDEIGEDTFRQLGSGYISQYSNDELSNMYYFLENEFRWQNTRLKGEISCVAGRGPTERDTGTLRVFDALTAFNYAVLIEENGMPLCQYTQLLRWRDMIITLEEDLFITSFLAHKDNLTRWNRRNFFWKSVIGHNNRALNCLVAKGVAENHFHLKGSAPYFHLSWLSIMNQVDMREFDDRFEEFEKNRLQKNLSISADYSSGKLSHMWRQAALVRVFLFSVLKGDCMEWPDIYVPAGIIMEHLQGEDGDKAGIGLKQRVKLGDYADLLGERTAAIRSWHSEYMVRNLLDNGERLKDAAGIIQDNINRFREEYGKRQLDYMICEDWLAGNGKCDVNGPLAGERWFLYRMFYAVYGGEARLEPYFNLFYFYLVIKANIRRELVQANQNVGFDNFLQYQDRKDFFVENSMYDKVYIRMAVRDTIYNQHITRLEARISPKGSAVADRNTIRKYDNWITEALSEGQRQELLDRYFYVFHFIKTSERINKNLPYLEECRHYQKREELRRQALAIAALRESGEPEAGRVKGIDACSPEIWCRPEVFAQAFRYLKNHWVDDGSCKTLLATYHVGEDFLDVVDGLRAIDEAVRFLNLHCGDRLGHALALGIDIDEWYESKSNKILINKMGYMDNLVWLYSKLRSYGIEGCDGVKSYIEKRFHEYFIEIYENNIAGEAVRDIMGRAAGFFDRHGMAHNYHHEHLMFGIGEYYDSWKLRGDNPELYREGFFNLQGKIIDAWDEFAVNKNFPQNYKIRYNPETAILYYMYHYNTNVKLTGDQMVEVKVSRSMVEAVKKVRDVMQREICGIGIGIETNPSSNYMIGTFRRYDRHPITRWYNYGLTADQEALERCPQMQVSINTDDQGVFSTYIENEYAYLALALEKCRDGKGGCKYNRTMILQWLDNVRKMGIDQSFCHKGVQV